jgi:hypothetical protein
VSNHGDKQPVRHVPHALVRGVCMDCGQEFAGSIALHTVVVRGVPGIVVWVVNHNEMHALARVPMTLLPVVGE